jgi:hypothetical protein
LVGCANDSYIDLHGLAATNTLDDLVLQETQQLNLHGQRHVADFVKEERAMVGAFDSADILP